jgi:hypothetical protein
MRRKHIRQFLFSERATLHFTVKLVCAHRLVLCPDNNLGTSISFLIDRLNFWSWYRKRFHIDMSHLVIWAYSFEFLNLVKILRLVYDNVINLASDSQLILILLGKLFGLLLDHYLMSFLRYYVWKESKVLTFRTQFWNWMVPFNEIFDP